MNSAMHTELLRSILSAVRQDLKPELQSPQARHRADLVDMMLSRLATEIEMSENGVAAAAGGVDAQALSQLREGGEISDSTRAELARRVADFVQSDSARRGAIEQRLAELAVTEAAKKEPTDNVAISAEAFTAYFRQKFPEKTDITVTNVTVIPGGRSKGTILLDLEEGDKQDAVVIRRDFQANPTGVSVTYEYPVIKTMWQAGIPVPEPRWIEEDTSILGGAFIAFSKVPGNAMGTLFASDAPPGFVRDFARVLAELHAVDISGSDLASQLSWGLEEHPVRAMVDSFYEEYQKVVEPSSIMDAAFAWLYLQLENTDFRFGVVHGDAGLHNTLGEGERLTGLLDWEFSHAGDPAEDLTYCKGLIEKILPWEEFLAAYYQSGGQPISEARIRFFEIWRSVLLGVHMGRAKSLFTSGASKDLRLAVIGFNSLPKILNDLAGSLAAFTK